MAINNSQAIKFCNEKARPLADAIGRLVRTMPQFMIEVAEYEKFTEANPESDKMDDGAERDGRPIVTKKDIAALKYVVERLIECMDQDDRIEIVNRVAVNTLPHF